MILLVQCAANLPVPTVLPTCECEKNGPKHRAREFKKEFKREREFKRESSRVQEFKSSRENGIPRSFPSNREAQRV